MLWSGVVSVPTQTTYSPSSPISLASFCICTSPNTTESMSSTFQVRPSCSGPSWVMTGMPASWARFSTGSVTFTSSGTRPITSTFWAIRSSKSFTCWAASRLGGPTMEVSMPKSVPAFFMPFSSALNQGMPAILTTVTIFFWSCAKARPEIPTTPMAAATAAAPKSFHVSLFMDTSSLQQISSIVWSQISRPSAPAGPAH